MKNKSPLRYPGGKTRACKQLDKILNENFDMNSFNTVVSPFLGGGSFEFYLQNKYDIEIKANDKFEPLYNFWINCKENKRSLCESLFKQLNKVTKETFKNLREQIMNTNDKLKQSEMYFIINRCSFSGATLSGGFSMESSKKRFTKSSIERVNELDLSKLEMSNQSFDDFLEANTEEKSFIFLDPPYYLEKGSKLYGKNGDLHENFDHNKLFESISSKKNWIMTYNNCEHIRNLYKRFKIVDASWSYGMNKSKSSSEIVIIG